MLTEVPVCELGTHSLKKSQELLTTDCLLLRTSAHYISRVFLKAKIPSQSLNRNCDRRNGILINSFHKMQYKIWPFEWQTSRD